MLQKDDCGRNESSPKKGIPWPTSYGAFTLGLGIVAWITFLLLRFFENRKLRNTSRLPGSEIK